MNIFSKQEIQNHNLRKWSHSEGRTTFALAMVFLFLLLNYFLFLLCISYLALQLRCAEHSISECISKIPSQHLRHALVISSFSKRNCLRQAHLCFLILCNCFPFSPKQQQNKILAIIPALIFFFHTVVTGNYSMKGSTFTISCGYAIIILAVYYG